jgi:hypothetical protein
MSGDSPAGAIAESLGHKQPSMMQDKYLWSALETSVALALPGAVIGVIQAYGAA